MSANVSYEHAADDIAYFTGVEVPHSVQQRLVHRQEFPKAEVEAEVKELSADGGNIRLRTPKGEPCTWQGYKAVCLHESAVAAACENNPQLIEWVQRQPLAATVTCLGDGHDGVWNLIQPMMPDAQRREVATFWR